MKNLKKTQWSGLANLDIPKFAKTRLVILGMLLGLMIACSKDEPTPTPDPEPVKSSEKQMTSFRFTGIENNGVTVDIPGEIDEQAKAITAKMPSGTNINA